MNSQRINRAIEAVNFGEYDFDDETKTEIILYVRDNADGMHEVTPNIITKIADLALLCPDDWKQTADFVVLTWQARIRKIISH
jgi:hypothetical protein